MNTPLVQFVAALLRSSLTAVVLMLLVLAVQRAFRKQLSPHWQCALWLLVIVRLIPFSWPAAVSVYNLVPGWSARASPTALAAAAEAGNPGTISPVAAPGAVAVPSVPAVASAAVDSWRVSWIDWGFALWLAGTIGLAGYVAGATMIVQRKLARARRIEEPELLALIRDASSTMAVRHAPAAFESDAVGAPTLCGVLRGRLILPVGFAHHYSRAEQRLVVLHELAHLRRRDLLLNWLVTILQIVHWFNPLLWLGLARWRGDREIACDAWAIEKAGVDSARLYGQTMLRILEDVSLAPPRVGLVGILEDKRQLQRRIRSIFGPVAARRPIVPMLLIAVLGVVGLTDAQEPVTPSSSTSTPTVANSSEAGVMLPRPRRLNPLSAEQATALEARVQANPEDLDARLQLVQHYWRTQFSSEQAKTEHQRQVLWLIEHHPEAMEAGPASNLLARVDGGAYDAGKRLWERQVAAHPRDAMILARAASYLGLNDREEAEKLWKQAEQLQPNNPNWAERLAHLYSLSSSSSGNDENAQKAFTEMERADAVSSDHFDRLVDLAKMAFAAGDLGKAQKYAERLLAEAPAHAGQWNYGNAIHHGNIVLGRIALHNGDVEDAKKYLLAAGKTPGSPQLNSFGPNMTLARELAQKGETHAVIAYFDLCRKFWKLDRGRLDDWTALVKEGRVPDFGANLRY